MHLLLHTHECIHVPSNYPKHVLFTSCFVSRDLSISILGLYRAIIRIESPAGDLCDLTPALQNAMEGKKMASFMCLMQFRVRGWRGHCCFLHEICIVVVTCDRDRSQVSDILLHSVVISCLFV